MESLATSKVVLWQRSVLSGALTWRSTNSWRLRPASCRWRPRTAGPRCVATAVRFYQLVGSVKADITEGGALFEGALESEDFKGARGILEAVMELGRQFVAAV